jgi:hypothetical protein
MFAPDGGKPRPVTPEGYRGITLSQDGTRLAVIGPDDAFYVTRIDGSGPPVQIPGLSNPQDAVVGWTAEGRILVRRGSGTHLPLRVETVDPATGQVERQTQLMPADATGVNALQAVKFGPNGSYAYSYYRNLGTLYLVEGVK